MTLEEFKGKVASYLALVCDGHLSEDDAADAALDCLTAVPEHQQNEAYDFYSDTWIETFYGKKPTE